MLRQIILSGREVKGKSVKRVYSLSARCSYEQTSERTNERASERNDEEKKKLFK